MTRRAWLTAALIVLAGWVGIGAVVVTDPGIPDPLTEVVGIDGQRVTLNGWTHAEWAGHEVGLWLNLQGQDGMRAVGCERRGWVSPLVPETERGTAWSCPWIQDRRGGGPMTGEVGGRIR